MSDTQELDLSNVPAPKFIEPTPISAEEVEAAAEDGVNAQLKAWPRATIGVQVVDFAPPHPVYHGQVKNLWHSTGSPLINQFLSHEFPDGLDGNGREIWPHATRSAWLATAAQVAGQWQHISYGPYLPLPPGNVLVHFFIGYDPKTVNDPNHFLVALDVSHGGQVVMPGQAIGVNDSRWYPGPKGLRIGRFDLVGPGGPDFNARVLSAGKADIYHFQTRIW